jgi:hypothetical protein
MTKPIAGHIMPNEHMITPATAIGLLVLDFTKAIMPNTSPVIDADEPMAIFSMPGMKICGPLRINVSEITSEIIPRIIAAIPMLPISYHNIPAVLHYVQTRPLPDTFSFGLL